jgi:site-specific recombinase XerD
MVDTGTSGGTGPVGTIDEVLEGFARYARHERGLAPTTVENYLNQVRPFVFWYAGQGHSSLDTLTIQDVNRFLTWRAESCSAGSIRVATTALRALLRWMFLDGRLARQLAEGIGPIRYVVVPGLPKALSAEDLAAILALDMSARDRALVLLLSRLGLRSGEVARLRLDDVHWRAGTVSITGKGQDHQLMPLTVEVGQALATYLRAGRGDDTVHRHVFLTAVRPYRPLGRIGVSCVVTRLAHRAGLDGRVGAHRLRHGAATSVLAGGGTLAEAGQLLRHRSIAATAIYAKVDDRALAQLVRPWPAAPMQATR